MVKTEKRPRLSKWKQILLLQAVVFVYSIISMLSKYVFYQVIWIVFLAGGLWRRMCVFGTGSLCIFLAKNLKKSGFIDCIFQ